jgi:hypothetical protein
VLGYKHVTIQILWTIISTGTVLEKNLGVLSEKPATNRLRHGTAKKYFLYGAREGIVKIYSKVHGVIFRRK